MREHEMDISRPAPRHTSSVVLWMLFTIVVGGICLLATMPEEVLVSSSSQVGRSSIEPSPLRAPTVSTADREPTAMGD